MDKSSKHEWRKEVEVSLDKSNAFFVARYSGMTVEELTEFRRELRKVQAEFSVIKNTVVHKAIEQRDERVTTDLFVGQTGVIFAYGDVAAAAKAFSEAAKKNEKLGILGGYMEKSKLSPTAVNDLALLPSREVLMSRLVGSLVAPHRGLLGALNGVHRNLVQVLSAIKDKKAS